MENTSNTPEHVTIIKERGSGAGIMLGVLFALVLAVIAILLITQRGNVDPSDASIAAAADKVGAAAQQVGNAAEDAAKNIR